MMPTTNRRRKAVAKVPQPPKHNCDLCGVLDGDKYEDNGEVAEVTTGNIAGLAGKHKKGDLCHRCMLPLVAIYEAFRGRPVGRKTGIDVTDPRAITPPRG